MSRRGCGPVFLALLHQGLVDPGAAARDHAAGWVAAGAVTPGAEDRVRALLDTRPSELADTEAVWITLADWWSQLRLAAAAAAPLPEPLRADVDAAWDDLDAAFRAWSATRTVGCSLAVRRRR